MEQRRLVSVRTLTRTAAVFLIVISFFSLFFFFSLQRPTLQQKGYRKAVVTSFRVWSTFNVSALSLSHFYSYDGDARVGHAETRKRRGEVDAVRRTGERHHGTRNHSGTRGGVSSSETAKDGITRNEEREREREREREKTTRRPWCQAKERGVYIRYLIRNLRLPWMRWMPLRVSCTCLGTSIRPFISSAPLPFCGWLPFLRGHRGVPIALSDPPPPSTLPHPSHSPVALATDGRG